MLLRRHLKELALRRYGKCRSSRGCSDDDVRPPGPERVEDAGRRNPAGRLAQPDEISSLVYFLALPESGYINGQIISPNGVG